MLSTEEIKAIEKMEMYFKSYDTNISKKLIDWISVGDFNAKFNVGELFEYSCQFGCESLISRFIEHVNETNLERGFFFVYTYNHFKCIKLFKDKNVDFEKGFNTCCFKGRKEAVQEFLKLGKVKNTKTGLSYAKEKGHIDIVNFYDII